MKYRVTNATQRARLIEDIEAADLPLWVETKDGRDRSLSQNALAWKWYGEIGQQAGLSVEEAHCFAKLHFGIPILRRDSEAFRETYDRLLKPLAYEDKLEAMALVDVTSIMTVKQMTEYLDTLYRDQSQRGVALTDPGEPAVMRGAA